MFLGRERRDYSARHNFAEMRARRGETQRPRAVVRPRQNTFFRNRAARGRCVSPLRARILRSCGARIITALAAQEHIFELIHARVRKEAGSDRLLEQATTTAPRGGYVPRKTSRTFSESHWIACIVVVLYFWEKNFTQRPQRKTKHRGTEAGSISSLRLVYCLRDLSAQNSFNTEVTELLRALCVKA